MPISKKILKWLIVIPIIIFGLFCVLFAIMEHALGEGDAGILSILGMFFGGLSIIYLPFYSIYTLIKHRKDKFARLFSGLEFGLIPLLIVLESLLQQKIGLTLFFFLCLATYICHFIYFVKKGLWLQHKKLSVISIISAAIILIITIIIQWSSWHILT